MLIQNNFLLSETFIREYSISQENLRDALAFVSAAGDWLKSRDISTADKLVASYIEPVFQTLELGLLTPLEDRDNIYPVTFSWDKVNPVALCFVTAFGEDLDDLAPESGQCMIQAVNVARSENSKYRWVILTDGRLWRLLDAYALQRYEAFIQFDLDALIRNQHQHKEVELFYACFSHLAFSKGEDESTGLEKLLDSSEKETKAAEEYLKASVSNNLEVLGDNDGIMAQLCLGIVNATGKTTFTEEERDAIYQDAIHLLYRLLFILYAEARELLPVPGKEYSEISLGNLVSVAKKYHLEGLLDPTGTSLWKTLTKLFDAIDLGDDILKVPAYNGGLFRNEDKPYLRECYPTDLYLSEALFYLAHMPIAKGDNNGKKKYIEIDYRDLSVRHFGSLYEGMIEYKLFIAEEKLFARRDNKGDTTFIAASSTQKQPNDFVIEEGQVYFAQSPGERRATGTHYTYESLVEKLVNQTLIPTIEARLKPLKEKQIRWANEIDYASDKEKLRRYLDRELITFVENEIFSLRVADISMGSGHFLVHVAHRITNTIIEILSSNPWESSEIELDPNYWRKKVVEQCLYGVDSSLMAVELAKLSLWIISMEPGKPLSFLDHHIREGDSLVGARLYDLAEYWPISSLAPSEKKSAKANKIGQMVLDEAPGFERLKKITSLYNSINSQVAENPEDAKIQARDYEDIREELKPYYDFATLVVAKLSGYSITDNQLETIAKHLIDETLNLKDYSQLVRKPLIFTRELNLFHWDLEFPNIFLVNDSSIQPIQFDIIVGNPPYLSGLRISSEYGDQYLEFLKEYYSPSYTATDLSAYFFRKAFTLLREGGLLGMVATKTIGQGDTRRGGLAVIIENGGIITYADRFIRWEGDAAVEVNLIAISKPSSLTTQTNISPILDNAPVNFISSRLDDQPEIEPKPLKANDGKSYIGSYVLGMGFVLEPSEAEILMKQDPNNKEVIYQYLIGDDVNSDPNQAPSRFVINFHDWPLDKAEEYPLCLNRVRKLVKPQRDNLKRKRRRDNWWLYAEYAPGLYDSIKSLSRVLVRSRVSELHAMVFVENGYVYGDALVVFAFDDFYHFALLRSSLHEIWVWKNSSSLGSSNRYTPTGSFRTFPFPQNVNISNKSDVDKVGEEYYNLRDMIMNERGLGLTNTYNLFNSPSCNEADIHLMREKFKFMDYSILNCFGWADLGLEHDFYPFDRGKIRYTISERVKKEIIHRLTLLNQEMY